MLSSNIHNKLSFTKIKIIVQIGLQLKHNNIEVCKQFRNLDDTLCYLSAERVDEFWFTFVDQLYLVHAWIRIHSQVRWIDATSLIPSYFDRDVVSIRGTLLCLKANLLDVWTSSSQPWQRGASSPIHQTMASFASHTMHKIFITKYEWNQTWQYKSSERKFIHYQGSLFKEVYTLL